MSDRKNSKSYVAEAVIATSILVLGASVYLWYHSRPKKDGGNNGSTDLVATEHMREVRLKRFDRPGASCVSRARYNTSKTTATSKKFRLPIPNVIGTKSDGGSDNAHYHASPETREDLNRMVKKKPITQVTEPTNNLAGGINANIRAPSSKIGKKSQQNADAKVLATSATVNDRKVTAGTVAAELRKPPVTGIAEEVEAEVEAEVEVEVEAEVEAYGGSGDVEQIYLTNENKIKYVFGEGYYLSLLSNGAGAGADVSARSGGDGDGGNDNGGEDRNITSSSLILLLRNVSQTEKALELAAGWWRKTLELSCRSSSALPITLWQTAILNSVNELLSERTPEEDIFTILSPEEDFAKPFLALLGYTLVNETSRVASPSGGGAALYSVRRKNPTTGTSAHRIPASFMRVVSSCHPVSARTALELLFSSLFGKYRLDTLPEHALDVGVLQALRQDRAVGGMLGVALQWEVLARPRQAQQQVIATTTTTTTTTESSSTSATRNRTPISSCTTHLVSAGQMERNCVLAPLMCLTTIVPLTRVTGTNRGTQETTSSAKYPQESFFADPSYVRSSGGGGSATDMGRYIPEVGKLMHMLQRNMAEVTGLLHDLIESAMKQKENREGVLTWMSHILHVNHRFFSEGGHRDLREDELSCPDASSSGFILNFCSVMLLLMHPLLSNPGKFVPQVDWCFAMTDTRIDFSQLANLVDGSKVAVSTHSATSSSSSSSSLAPSSSPSHGGSICQEEEEDATEAVAKNASASSSGSPALDDTSSSSSSSSACSSSSSSSSSSAFSFATEIFWLTGRAMELLVKLDRRRNEHMQVVGIHFEHLKQQYNAAPSSDLEEALGRAKRNIHTLHCGWAASQLGDVEFLSQACRWAQFASQWLIEQARSTDATERFRHCPAGLVKAMCEVWLLAARLPQLPQHRPSREAMPGTLPADAALLCVELMGRPDLCGSAVVQDRLLEVVGVFVGSTASAGGGGGGKQPARMTMKSMPAPRNSLADVVMNNSVIREQLVPAIMQLYSNCHAVAALDVNEDVSFDKNSLRHRANGIIESLYRYPLEEPRASIRTFVHQNAVGFEAFVVSAFDCIMYNFVEAIKTLIFYRQRQQQWKQQTTAWSEGKQAILPLGEEESRMRGKVKTMLRMTQSTYEMLQLLCEGEGCVCDGILRNASLRHRVSYYLYSCLNYVNSEAKLAKLEVEDAKEDWGVDLALVVSQPVKLIAVLLIHASSEDDKVTKENKGEQKTGGGGGGGGGSLAHAFLSSLAEHPDFEWDDLLNVASLPGGEMLHSSTDLIRSMKNESTGMNSTSSIGTALSSSSSSSSSSYSLSKASETPDKNISKIDDTIDFDMYIHEEGDAVDAYAKFWDTEEQVAAVENGFAGGNFFQRIHSAHAAGANGGSGGTTTTGGGGGGGSGLRAIIRDYTKKTKAMLPPALRDATIAIRYDEDQPSYGRAFLTGPVDSPYFGGIFIFDIYFPKDFPTVPPLVQLLNTAGGTERFHPNLYADGKVCVSLLGTNEGHATERWDAKVSSLGQVLVSIQSLILGEYLPGAVGQHVTVDGRHVTAEDYYEYRLATLRHAILPLLQSCRGAGPYAAAFPELQPLFLAYFRANRHRMLQVLKHSIEDLQQPSGSSSSNSSGGGGGAAAAKLRKEVSRLVAEFHKCDSL